MCSDFPAFGKDRFSELSILEFWANHRYVRKHPVGLLKSGTSATQSYAVRGEFTCRMAGFGQKISRIKYRYQDLNSRSAYPRQWIVFQFFQKPLAAQLGFQRYMRASLFDAADDRGVASLWQCLPSRQRIFGL
jgi:hypothetical protein